MKKAKRKKVGGLLSPSMSVVKCLGNEVSTDGDDDGNDDKKGKKNDKKQKHQQEGNV